MPNEYNYLVHPIYYIFFPHKCGSHRYLREKCNTLDVPNNFSNKTHNTRHRFQNTQKYKTKTLSKTSIRLRLHETTFFFTLLPPFKLKNAERTQSLKLFEIPTKEKEWKSHRKYW